MKLQFDDLMKILRAELEQLPEQRKGENIQYEVADAALSAFAVFFTQSASFLAYQRKMKGEKGRSNAESMFGIKKIPSDSQIRRILDGIDARELEGIFYEILDRVEQEKILESYRGYEGRLLIAIDGTDYHASRKIACKNCTIQEDEKGKLYRHIALTPILEKPGETKVLALMPEYIQPQDGHEKQDCERNAAKRWIDKHGAYFGGQKSIILGDDLYCNQPFCEHVEAQGLDYVLICKEDSHVALYEMLSVLEKCAGIQTYSERKWNGRFGEISTYRYVETVPLRRGEDALQVNWCEIKITHETTQEVLYYNAFITNLPLTTDQQVIGLTAVGRSRWKIENENNNVLKTKGYHLEHNFGHGTQSLSSFLLSLNLLAFLFHTLLEISDQNYRLLREKLAVRKTFFRDIETLTRYIFFENWDALLLFMLKGLNLLPP